MKVYHGAYLMFCISCKHFKIKKIIIPIWMPYKGKDKANFKIYDATTWSTNNSNTFIDQYLKK